MFPFTGVGSIPTVLATTLGFTYYVDSVNGNDSNSGRSPTTALKTLTALPTLFPYDTVRLVTDSIFRNQKFANIPNNLTIEAYGSGAKPIMRGDASLSSGGWSKTVGRTFVYERTITFDADPSGYMLIFENDAFMARKTSVANVDSNAGSYYCTSDTAGTATLYIHATGDGDPASNGKTYDYTKTALSIDAFSAVGVKLRGVIFKRSLYQNGYVYLGKNSYAYSCDFQQNSRHNFICRGGFYGESCTFTDGYYAGAGATLFVCYEASPTAADTVTLISCTASNSGSPDTAVTGYLNHGAASPGTNFGPVTYISCAAQNVATGWSCIDSTLFTFTSCTFSTVTYGISVGVASTFNITGVTGSVFTFGVEVAAAATVNVTTPNLTSTAAGFGGCIHSTAGGTITMSGGTLTSDNPTNDGARGCFGINTTNTTWIINGMRIALRRPVYFVTNNHTLNAMDNQSYSNAAAIWQYQGSSRVGLAAWKSATGFDTNSTQDP